MAISKSGEAEWSFLSLQARLHRNDLDDSHGLHIWCFLTSVNSIRASWFWVYGFTKQQSGKWKYMLRFCVFSLLLFKAAFADELKVAVAANFAEPMQVLAPQFEKETGHKIIAAFGSTGKFYAQIENGAPFEVFLAADAKHPQLLEAGNLAVPGTRFTYATGKIVLWSPKAGFVDAEAKVLTGKAFQFIAIANPDVAPYGRAAKEYLTARRLWETLSGKITMGQDIGQTYQFVSTGNAELGFVALSQVSGPGKTISGSYFIVPQNLYKLLEQQAIQIKKTKAGEDFLQFLKKPAIRGIIRGYGYGIP